MPYPTSPSGAGREAPARAGWWPDRWFCRWRSAAGGIKTNKREGDGGTPRGSFRLRRLWWRGDRHPRPATALPVRRVGPADGWCEDPSDRHYNQPVKVPENSKADRLARADHLYDFIIELDHNTRPRVKRTR